MTKTSKRPASLMNSPKAKLLVSRSQNKKINLSYQFQLQKVSELKPITWPDRSSSQKNSTFRIIRKGVTKGFRKKSRKVTK